jgi:outer membrane receptor protein involved in Fe transport
MNYSLPVTLRAALYAGAAVSSLGVSTMASAQEDVAQPATDAPADEAGEGNDIIVTASKREQTLQDVPIAVSVTTAETIERAQIRDIKDLGSVVPSLRVGDRQSSQNATFYIRGFGNGANNPGIEPSVGVFIDGVYRSRTASTISDLPDIRRVEVLRGPQSTLFGKNASAGVVSVVTLEPEFKFGGNVEASYGNYNALVVKGRVTGPISDTLAVSLAGGVNKRDGYVRDLGTGNRTNERNRWFARGQLLFKPSDDFKIRIIGDYGHITENCCAVVSLKQGQATQALLSPLINGRTNDPNNPFGDVVYNNFDSINDIKNWGVSGQIDYDLGPITLTSITAYRRTHAITNQDADFTSGDLLGRKYENLRIKTFTQEFRANANFADKVNVLLGAFYYNEKIDLDGQVLWGTQARSFANILAGGLGTSLPALENLFGSVQGNSNLYTGQFFGANQGLTENYRMSNNSISIFAQVDVELTDRLTLTGGINFTHDSKRFVTNTTSNDVFAGLNIPALQIAARDAGIAQAIGTNFFGGVMPTPAQIASIQTNFPVQYATIFNAATAQTQPLLALRSFQFFPPFQNVPNPVEPGRTSDNNVSYTARLAYDATDDINVYASFATGFKASSINLGRDSKPTEEDRAALIGQGLGVTNLVAGSRLAGPEKSTVYELGIKANWGIATANLAVFKQIIRGFQSNIFTGTGFFLANAGKQSVFGIEFEGTVKPANGLTLGLAMTYLDPKYDDFRRSAFGDASGTTPADVPPISATFSLDYEHRMANDDRLIFHGDFHYEAPVQVVEGLPNFLNLPGLTPDQALAGALGAARPFRREVEEINASLTYAMRNGLEFSVWGRNLLNDRYLSLIFDSPAQTGSISGYINQPRTYGASARFRW